MNYYNKASDLKVKCITNFKLLLSGVSSTHIDFKS